MVKHNEYMDKQSDEELWSLYAETIHALKSRNLVRTRNIVGERGEFLAIKTYNKTSGLPKLQAAPESTQNIDAISKNGERYSIKTITSPGKTTGVFYGLGTPQDKELPNKKFEYVIIVVIDNNLMPEIIIELDWNLFIKYKKWHSRMNAWNLSLTNNLIADSKIIYKKNK